jgi:TrmH family RNA methyltransferase
MLSKNQAKYIRSLAEQKHRREHSAFIAEGDKLAKEWLQSDSTIQMIVGSGYWLDENKALLKKHPEAEIISIEDFELQAVSGLQTANQVLLVVKMNNHVVPLPAKEWCIALDTMQDPGNMGTIIRIADWFGIKHIVASHDSVDFYNPKVIQSAMGGHLRVQLHKTDLHEFVRNVDMPIIAAALEGSNIYTLKPLPEAVLLIGNESKGLHPALIASATHAISIPGKGGAESLNAAVSAGIICALLLPR